MIESRQKTQSRLSYLGIGRAKGWITEMHELTVRGDEDTYSLDCDNTSIMLKLIKFIL
jgi:hypothetical protein